MKLQETRVCISSKLTNEQFVIKNYNFDVQYFPYYQARITEMRNMIENNAKCRWKDNKIVKLHDLGETSEDQDKQVIIVGTLFKQMILQPSILKEVSEENQLMPQPILERFTSEDDALWLQDGDESIMLKGNIDVGTHVTGICLALLGHEEDDASRFVVEDVCFCQLEPKESIPTPLSTDKYVAFISGLGFSKNCYTIKDWNRGISIFTSLINGELSDKYAVKGSAIARVIIAGNCIGKNARKEESESEIDNKTPWNKKIKSNTTEATKLIDDFIARLGTFIDVDIMPGELDPTNQLIPQQALHHCILPKSFKLNTVRSVTNPYSIELDGLNFLGTSGQNVKSIKQYSTMTESITIMHRMIDWAHIAPTAPDTLYCYPYCDQDPFVLTKMYPDVYFVGNQVNFNSNTIEAPNGQKVLLVSIPDFESTYSCVLVNLKNLSCEMISLA